VRALVVPTSLIASLAAAAPAAAQLPVPIGPPPPEPASQQPAPEQPQERSPSYTRLSDERLLSRWAYVVERAPVRKGPDDDAKRITRLRYDTEDGLPEVYLALRRYDATDGTRWVQIRLPMRPNGRTGWVRRDALGRFHVVRTALLVDRKRMRATLYRRGERVWRARVGVGAPGMHTPAGRFYVRERLKVRRRGSLYGPLAFGTSAYSKLSDWPGGGIVGIHGTPWPWLLGQAVSHGCVRVHNAAIAKLRRWVPVGTPIRIVA
jgi:hypothetical protein